jgi:hypothetical protein
MGQLENERYGEMMIPGMKSRPEEDEQAAFFDYLNRQTYLYPWLIVAHAIPNGGARPKSERTKGDKTIRYCPAGAKLKRQGQRPGVADVFIPAPRGQYHGLYIEFKRRDYLDLKGRRIKAYPSSEQKAFQRWVEALGYKCVVCHGSDEAMETLSHYIELPPAPGTRYELFSDPGFLTVTS